MSEKIALKTEEETAKDATKDVGSEEPVTQVSDVTVPEAAGAKLEKESEVKDDEEKPPSLPNRKDARGVEQKTPAENPIFKQLKEAFPNLEDKSIKAVIIASQGAVDPAFNALLYLSDPESGRDIELPSEPVTTQPPELPARRRQSQLEQDEMLARQLDQQYNKTRQRPRHQRPVDGEREAYRQRLRDRQRRGQQPLTPEEQRELEGDDDSWAQFMEKDLPELRDRANKSIQETATKLNGWFSGIRKNLVGEEADSAYQGEQQRGGWYDDPYSREQDQHYAEKELPKKPERRRFNSFGAQIGDDSLENHGITLQNNDLNDDLDEEDDIPPQLGTKTSNKDDREVTEGKVVAQTTYIDTPDNANRKKWQPVPPEPVATTPTKTSGKPVHGKNADEDDFLINSEDEM